MKLDVNIWLTAPEASALAQLLMQEGPILKVPAGTTPRLLASILAKLKAVG